MVSITEDGYNVHLQFTPDLANDWKNAMLASSELAVGNYHYLTRRVLGSMNASQLESKLWLVQTLEKFDVQPKRVALLAGWIQLPSPQMAQQYQLHWPHHHHHH